MADDRATAEIARLEALVGSDPGSEAFPALVEAHRRAGNLEAAAQVAREGIRRRPEELAGRVALGLVLLDLGREADARQEFERALDAVRDHPLAARAPGRAAPSTPVAHADSKLELEAIGDGEIDAAFDEAQAEPEKMLSADSVAQQVLRSVELGEAPQIERAAASDAGPPGPPPALTRPPEEIPFATSTVADLLENQGHWESARAMREALRPSRARSAPEPSSSRGGSERVVATLERWLDNLRRRPR